MRTSSSPSASRAIPMLSVEARRRVSRKDRSHASIASHRSSSGVRFHCPQCTHTAHSRPFAASKARRRPKGKCSMTSFAPRLASQKRQAEYITQETRRQQVTQRLRDVGGGGGGGGSTLVARARGVLVRRRARALAGAHDEREHGADEPDRDQRDLHLPRAQVRRGGSGPDERGGDEAEHAGEPAAGSGHGLVVGVLVGGLLDALVVQTHGWWCRMGTQYQCVRDDCLPAPPPSRGGRRATPATVGALLCAPSPRSSPARPPSPRSAWPPRRRAPRATPPVTRRQRST